MSGDPDLASWLRDAWSEPGVLPVACCGLLVGGGSILVRMECQGHETHEGTCVGEPRKGKCYFFLGFTLYTDYIIITRHLRSDSCILIFRDYRGGACRCMDYCRAEHRPDLRFSNDCTGKKAIAGVFGTSKMITLLSGTSSGAVVGKAGTRTSTSLDIFVENPTMKISRVRDT